MKITKLTQPKGTNLCGQTIVAMLGNISIQKAMKIMGKGGCTRTKDVIQALRKLKFRIDSDRLLRIPKNWVKPELCIVHIGFGNYWKKHWILWNGYENCFYDPAFKLRKKETFYNNDWTKMLSYFEIKENKSQDTALYAALRR